MSIIRHPIGRTVYASNWRYVVHRPNEFTKHVHVLADWYDDHECQIPIPNGEQKHSKSLKINRGQNTPFPIETREGDYIYLLTPDPVCLVQLEHFGIRPTEWAYMTLLSETSHFMFDSVETFDFVQFPK